MALSDQVEKDFNRRVRTIPKLGLGLSVDVYAPDLFDLMRELGLHDLRPAYLEIFKASTTALQTVRRHFPDMPLTYHGEGLWVTQPDFSTTPFLDEDLAETVQQLATLQSHWLNHECATKQMAGYSFGTYLPPLYTRTGASVAADNITLVQRALDMASRDTSQVRPLFLLEMPPLTYFSAGTIGVPEFFQLVTDHAPCGLVLDIGHLWTAYRYTTARREQSLEQFVRQFLEKFPLQRVVEIHVAGLAEHEAIQLGDENETIPAWIDAHAAPIPSVLFSMLEQVLADSRLVNLRAVALEVDTKPIASIVDEFQHVSRRFGETIRLKIAEDSPPPGCELQLPQNRSGLTALTESGRKRLLVDYNRYAKIVSGQMKPTGSAWQAVMKDGVGLERYTMDYLPNEILHWGGELTQMFPDTCRAMVQDGVALKDFVVWWFQAARPVEQPYDFFLLKVRRFVEFACERVPTIRSVAEREADMLRRAYAETNDVQLESRAELIR